jgi:hypothetical protein
LYSGIKANRMALSRYSRQKMSWRLINVGSRQLSGRIFDFGL